MFEVCFAPIQFENFQNLSQIQKLLRDKTEMFLIAQLLNLVFNNCKLMIILFLRRLVN